MADGKLKKDALYIGDNGRMFCGELRCAGATAHFCGNDLSGQSLHKVTAKFVAALKSLHGMDATCESCGKESQC